MLLNGILGQLLKCVQMDIVLMFSVCKFEVGKNQVFWVSLLLLEIASKLHPSLHLTVGISRSSRPIPLWSLIGATSTLKLWLSQDLFIRFNTWQWAWSRRMRRGTPFSRVRFCRNFHVLLTAACSHFAVDGSFEKQSIHAKNIRLDYLIV